jgi:hypothetical protein
VIRPAAHYTVVCFRGSAGAQPAAPVLRRVRRHVEGDREAERQLSRPPVLTAATAKTRAKDQRPPRGQVAELRALSVRILIRLPACLLADFRQTMFHEGDRPQGRAGIAAPARADRSGPGTWRRHPGLGERPWHRGERPRAHPRQRRGAVRSRHQTILTGWHTAGPGQPRLDGLWP